MVNRERLLNTFLELVKIPSPSRRERAVMDHIRSQVQALGFEAAEDNTASVVDGGAGNLLVRIPANGGGRKLLLSAHVDTVERGDCAICPKVEGDVVSSAGDTILGADDKSGVAALLEFMACLKENDIRHGELLFCFSVCEEIELLGAKALDSEAYAGFDGGIVLDNSYPYDIIMSAPYKTALKITVNGVGGHGAYPDGKINAALVLATALSRLDTGRLDPESTSCLGIVRAGEAINIVPATAYAEYEVRSRDKWRLEFHVTHALATIEGAVRQFRALNPNDSQNPLKATVEVEVDDCYAGYCHDEDSFPVTFLVDAIRKAGMEPQFTHGQGGADANIYNANGLPVVNLGSGMHSVHCSRETANVSEMAGCVEVLINAVSAS